MSLCFQLSSTPDASVALAAVRQVVIEVDDPRAPDLSALVAQQLAFAAAHSPPEHVHALNVDKLLDPTVTLYSYRLDGELLGVGALKQLDARHVELKSMHTAGSARGRGIGRTLLAHLVCVAHDRGAHRISLETGSMPAFAPARSLYTRAGFTTCEPFADYRASRYSTFLTLALS